MHTTCPLCKSTSYLRHKVSDYKYYACGTCKTLFLSPKPNRRKIVNYYKCDFIYQAGKTNENILKSRARIIINKLKEFNPKASKLLDIGSGLGYLVVEACNNNLRAIGIEPSELLILNPSYKNAESVFNGTFDEYFKTHEKERFDFITLVHVIEHVGNPKRLIGKALKLLNKNGILYIETPNYDSHLYKTERDNYTFLTPPDHLWILSIKTFDMLVPSDYTIKYINTYSYSEHFMGIMKRYFKGKTANIDSSSHEICLSKYSVQHKFSLMKSVKYLVFDRFLARMLYRLLNLNCYGSILELCISKK